MTKLLITGGCGFLGHHLVEHFFKHTNWDIVILDKLTYASSGYDRLRDIQILMHPPERRVSILEASDRVKLIGCDLSNQIPEGVAHEIGDVDYVIHAAAETHVDRSITDPLPFIQSNVIGTHNLLWWARARGGHGRMMGEPDRLKRIILVSTDEVYGPAGWTSPGNTEHDPFRPANPYAAAKAGGEAIGMAYANTYGLPITIVNTMNLIGERQHWEKYVPLVIRRCMLGEKVLIHADPTRTRSGSRFYIHARNFAAALHHLIETDYRARANALGDGRPPSDVAREVMPLKIHVAGELEISNLDLATKIASVVGKQLHYELVDFHSSRPGHDLRYALDDTLVRSMGWRQPIGFDQSLERTVRWYMKNQRWLGF